MVNFKDPQNVRDIGPAVGEGIESGAQDHKLRNAALDRLSQFVLDVAGAHRHHSAGKSERGVS